MLRVCDKSYSKMTLSLLLRFFPNNHAILKTRKCERSVMNVEVFSLVCLIAFYKYLDSSTKKEAVVIEVYQDQVVEEIA